MMTNFRLSKFIFVAIVSTLILTFGSKLEGETSKENVNALLPVEPTYRFSVENCVCTEHPECTYSYGNSCPQGTAVACVPNPCSGVTEPDPCECDQAS